MSWRFYFEDTLERVEWWDNPESKVGPFNSKEAALFALRDWAGTNDPSIVGYKLMSDTQHEEALAARVRAGLASP